MAQVTQLAPPGTPGRVRSFTAKEAAATLTRGCVCVAHAGAYDLAISDAGLYDLEIGHAGAYDLAIGDVEDCC